MVKRSRLLAVNLYAFILLSLQVLTSAWIYIDYHRETASPHGIITAHPIIGLTLIIFIMIHFNMNRRWVAMQFK